MKNKIIAATSASALIGMFVYALISNILLELIAVLLAGTFISGFFYLIYEHILGWLEQEENKKQNQNYQDRMDKLKDKPVKK